MTEPTMAILGIAGSLRWASYHRAAQQLVPEEATIEIFELDGIPGFNRQGALGFTAHAKVRRSS